MSDRHNQPMQQGRLLDTRQTISWSIKDREEANKKEQCRLFFDFTEMDQGRGRNLIGSAQLPEDAQRIAACWNACLEIKTDDLGEGFLRDTLLANAGLIHSNQMAHAKIYDLQCDIERLNAEIQAGQSKKASAAEAILNVAVGAGVALLAQLIFYPLFNIHIPFSADLALMGIFTVISLVRSYALRRLFNFWGRKQ